MLPNVSQYSSQGPIPQFQALQGAGLPQMGAGLFAQPGAYGGNASFSHDSGQAGMNQQYPFGVQANPFAQSPFTPSFTQNPFLPGLGAANPYVQSPWSLNPAAHNPLLNSAGAHVGQVNPASQVVPLLAHLAQQVAIQSAVAQHIGVALHQLAQQLAGQNVQGYPGAGFGGGPGFAGTGQPFGGAGGQYFGQNPFAGAAQGGYDGFSPQAQAWGANRPQTIQ
jgi:hypothetical protein